MKEIKFVILYALIFLYFFSEPALSGINPRLELSSGAKGFLSSMDDLTYMYYKPYVFLGCRTDYFGIFAGYAYYFNYQIIDASYNTRYIGLNQVRADLEVTPLENLLVGFEFYYSIGESEYTRAQYLFKSGYDFKKISLYGEFNYDTVEYTFNRNEITSMSWDMYMEIAYYFNDSASIDLSYDHYYYSSKVLDYESHKNIFRFGFLKSFQNNILSLTSGLGMGWDSNDFFLVNVDAGINVYPWKYIKISTFYIYSYNSYLQYSSGSSDGTHIGADGILYDNDSMSHKLVFGISFEY